LQICFLNQLSFGKVSINLVNVRAIKKLIAKNMKGSIFMRTNEEEIPNYSLKLMSFSEIG
jgi:hypothetical protein